uniref:Uncharacterized protein n=1 Tax=Hyaloperonospora arabidopsidis (strain Emoy2) TaxID=559515 RepID=M4BQR3_HYAAE
MFHEINPLVLALVISPVHLSGDEGISHEHKCDNWSEMGLRYANEVAGVYAD